jgi:ABC-type transport system involved in multi-copper enzyme maturation permease subunit
MSESLQQLLLACPVLTLLLVLTALPWLAALDLTLARAWLRRPSTWGYLLAGGVGAGLVAAFLLDSSGAETSLVAVGRIYMALLQLQLTADFFVAIFAGLLWVWPRGAAVALAAFREGVRQPMFWLLTIGGFLLMAISPVLPYFTFGEDYKMVKELGFAQIMLFTAFFTVIAASSSISEEIEGRTAVTLMSKPVSRRQFLLGKFAGILLAGLVMTTLLGWFLNWVLLYKTVDDWNLRMSPLPDPAWVVNGVRDWFNPGPLADLARGIGLWVNDAGSLLPYLTIGFGHVMIMTAVAVALATRVPMLVNVPVCLAVYFLGHLTPILTAVSQNRYRLISFLAQVFDTVLPGLDLFDLSTAVVRDAPLPPSLFSLYTLEVSLYAVMYTTIALLFGLILFEDRDLA